MTADRAHDARIRCHSDLFVGRVGGLAVALGIGTAVALGQGVAHADTTTGGPGPSNDNTSQSKTEKPDTEPAGEQPDSAGSKKDESPLKRLLRGERPLAHTNDSDDSTDTDDTPQSRRTTATSHREAQDDNLISRIPDRIRQSTRKVFDRAHADDDSEPAGRTSPETPAPEATTPISFFSKTETVAAEVNDVATPAPIVDTTRRVVTTLVSAAVDAPAPDPVAPVAPQPTLLDVISWAWREINRTFNNQTPTLAYKPTANKVLDNGDIEGDLGAADADQDNLAYTHTDPRHGDVVVHPDGTFTYTPDPGYTGPDSFDVTVSDAGDGFHIHGLSGLTNVLSFGLIGNRGDTVTQTINVREVSYTGTPVVSGLSEPTDFRFLPDGRILFAEKGGAIKVATADGELQDTPVITLPTKTEWARGLLAVEVDPDYENNGYVYVSYVTPDNELRLSRLTVTDPDADALTIDPQSEKVLVAGDQPAGDDHLGGGLAFGPDGKLYWSVGDNVCCSVIDGSNSQKMTNIYGKVLRLNADGTAPVDNPYPDATGDGKLIYATGFRNPYRLSFAPDGTLLVADVGQSEWEEVNLVTAGGNYGWPNAEGPCNGIGTADCSTPSSYDNPIYAYRHDPSGGNSITGVLAYTGPGTSSDEKTVLIADFNQGWVKQLTFNSDYSSLLDEQVLTAAAPGNTNKLVQGPDGNIYQLTYDTGKLTRITASTDTQSV